MSLLSDLNEILKDIGITVETGIFTNRAPDEYAVLIPDIDSFEVFADGQPEYETQEVRIAIYTKGNYSKLRKKIIKALLNHDLTITSKSYIGYETDTGYHHYNIDVANHYSIEEILED